MFYSIQAFEVDVIKEQLFQQERGLLEIKEKKMVLEVQQTKARLKLKKKETMILKIDVSRFNGSNYYLIMLITKAILSIMTTARWHDASSIYYSTLILA